MRVRCPHCQNPLEIIADDLLTDIECPSCGSHFQMLANGSTCSLPRGGQSVGRFELLERVGMGAYGTVWKSRDPELDRIVALKIPRRDSLDGRATEQFLREARAAAQLRHPHIVSIHEVGRDDHTLYIVSDFIEGVNLREWLSGQTLAVREAAQLCRTLAEALQHAHECGIVHRDLKPSNIMLDRGGKPYITDFGLAKREADEITITLEGQVLGTPAYMSPEQAGGQAHDADCRSDVYSLGVILYQLITGEVPFRGVQRMLVVQIMHSDPRQPRTLNNRIPYDLETICLKCLEKEPRRRYQSAGQLADDLGRFLDGKPIAARPTTMRTRLWRWCKRHRAVAALASAVFLALLVGSAVSTYFAVVASANASALTRSLYESLMRQIQVTREARVQGYREVTRQLVDRARSLPTPAVNLDDLRREMVSVMGDFVGYPPTVLQGFPSEATTIALAPDGRELAIGFRDGSVWICDPASGHRRAELAGHPGPVGVIGYFADGDRLVSADSTGMVQQWQRGSPQWLKGESFRTGEDVASYAISSDARTLVALHDQRADVWRVDEQRRWQSIELPQRTPRSATLDPRQQLLAVGYTEQSTGKYGWSVWNLDDGQLRKSILLDLGKTYSRSIAFSNDSRLLAVGFDEALIVYETTGFQQLSFRRGDSTKAVAFSPSGTFLAAVDIRGRVTIWNAAADREVGTLHNWRRSTSRECLTYSADGRLLASSNADSVHAWNLAGAQEKRVLAGHRGGVPCVLFNHSGTLLATGSKDRTVRLWDPESGHLAAAVEFPGAVQTLAFSPESDLLAAGYWGEPNDGIQVVDIASGRKVMASTHDLTNVYCLALFRRDGTRYLAASGETGLTLWSLSGEPPEPLSMQRDWHEPGMRCLHLAVSADARWIAWVNQDSEIRRWDLAQRQSAPLHGPPLNQGWHGLAFYPSDCDLAYVTRQGAVEIWNVARDAHVSRLGEAGQFKAPHIALSRDGHWMAGLAEPDVIAVWDAKSGQNLFSFRAEQTAVWSLAWSPDSRRLAVGFADGGVAVWDMARIESELGRQGLTWQRRGGDRS